MQPANLNWLTGADQLPYIDGTRGMSDWETTLVTSMLPSEFRA